MSQKDKKYELLITDQQRKKYYALRSKIGYEEVDKLLYDMTGSESVRGVTIDQMTMVIRELERIERARKPKRYRRPLNPENADPEIISLVQCGLNIGHNKINRGARNILKDKYEFDFNERLALNIKRNIEKTRVMIVYQTELKTLPALINSLSLDFVISLHCNAFNLITSGTETLYYKSSGMGKIMAGILQAHLVKTLELPDRKIKGITLEDRGGFLLQHTKAPHILAESFFIDNDDDLARAEERFPDLVNAYCKAIEEIALLFAAGAITAKQNELIESLKNQIGFNDEGFKGFCRRIIKKDKPETAKQAQAILAGLKNMKVTGWQVKN